MTGRNRSTRQVTNNPTRTGAEDMALQWPARRTETRVSVLGLASRKSARQQEVEAAPCLHAPGDVARLSPGAPEEIAADRAADGAAGVLGHDQAAQPAAPPVGMLEVEN